jgi:hypothetical protein
MQAYVRCAGPGPCPSSYWCRDANSRRSLSREPLDLLRTSGVGEGREGQGPMGARLAGVTREGHVALRPNSASWTCPRPAGPRAWLQLVCAAIGWYPPPCRWSNDSHAKDPDREDQSPLPPHPHPAPRHMGGRRERNPAGLRRGRLRGSCNVWLLLAVHAAKDGRPAAAAALSGATLAWASVPE